MAHSTDTAPPPSARAPAPAPRRATCTSSPVVASSSSSRSGRFNSARAISARRCWPPDSAATRTPALSARSTSASTSVLRSRAARPVDPVQRRVIGQVLRHGQIGVERPGLEHHPKPGQRLARGAAQIMAGHLDGAAGIVVKPGDQRKQRGLACTVHPEKCHESPARHRQADIVAALEPCRKHG